MKKNLCLLLVCLLSAAAPLQAQDMQQAQKLIDQAQKYLYNNPKQASYYAAQASALFPEDEPSEVRAQAMILYCQAEQLLGNFDLSIKNLYDTQKYIHPTNKKQMAQLCSLMGRVYSKLGDYNKAIELNDKATSIFKSIGDSTSVAGCYNERGVMHHFMSEFTVAERFFQRALAINRAQRNLKEIATNLNNLCLYRGNIGARELICDNYEYSSMVYAAIGDYAQAYKYLDKRYHLGKELQSSNKLRNIEQEISYKRYQDQKYATEMQEQTYKIELLKRNLWLLGSVLILGIAFSIFLYKWYKRRKDLQLIEARYQLQLSEKEVAELKMHQQELELQNVHNELATSRQEATSFAVFLKSRNELLDKIRGMVKEGYKMDAQAITPHLKKINAFISQSQSGDKTNSALLTNIDDKSNEFLQRLVAIHPKLTQGEKYLATLLRVNLSTKEISMLTGTTPKTINMNRYRLRKSLNLSSEEDLTDYLQNI